MPMVAICCGFEENRAILQGIVLCEIHCFLHCECIKSINLYPGDFVIPCIVFLVWRMPFHRCPHCITVVFKEVNNGNFVEKSKVHPFKDLSLVGGTIPEKCDCYVFLVSLIFLCKSNTHCSRNLVSNNPTSPVELILDIIKVHRSSFTFRRARVSPKHFCKNFLHCDPS